MKDYEAEEVVVDVAKGIRGLGDIDIVAIVVSGASSNIERTAITKAAIGSLAQQLSATLDGHWFSNQGPTE